jgi:hypothetical protein
MANELTTERPQSFPDRQENGRFKNGVATTLRHGMSGTKIHKVWMGMLSRCSIPSATGYKNYGGRGISVCERWKTFELFFEDMGFPPEDGFTLDRIDNNRGYSPDNCRWSSRKEQNRNQRDLVFLEFDGRIKCLSAWAEELGMQASSIKARINRGWSVEKALSMKMRDHKPYERHH